MRCAIYTRKSSEEGLDQDFNSLDAQHEACAAYVASQRHEGWKLMPTRYDDGGVSGGTLDRAGLQRLIADIEAGGIDMIVVYKIDRLTRSLSDFARLIDRLEASGCSFVSVTQAFNTSSSMGRLTLNVLLSFAQFEREVTAERIRDKLAASKKKGMWMGGVVPLGYDARERALHVNAKEAALVREIFCLYRTHRSVARVEAILQERGVRTKRHTFTTGRTRGGVPFTRGAIHHLISNPIYIGRIRHKELLHEGLHDAIIAPDLWADVQAVLEGNTRGVRRSTAKRHHGQAVSSPLAGKLVDETGDRLTPSHAVKSGRRYRYYVSGRLLEGKADPGEGWRLPATQLEQAVGACAADGLVHSQTASRLLEGQPAGVLAAASPRLAAMAQELAGDRSGEALAALIACVFITPGWLRVHLDGDAVAGRLDVRADTIAPDGLIFEAAFTRRKRGVETRLCLAEPKARPDPVLIRAVVRAHDWWGAMRSGASTKAIADKEGLPQRRVAHLLKLAFLAPDITEAILHGRQPPSLTTETLIRKPIALAWDEQRAALGMGRL
jgi:DNA invertase Pin-like site-specific DNA recombinase